MMDQTIPLHVPLQASHAAHKRLHVKQPRCEVCQAPLHAAPRVGHAFCSDGCMEAYFLAAEKAS